MTALLVPLTPGADSTPDVVGMKFARLVQALPHASVPAAFCIPVDWFVHTLGSGRLYELAELFGDLHATVGHDLTAFEFRLTALFDGLMIPRGLRSDLENHLAHLPGPWAVRSSSTVEDGTQHSHAGLYESFLNLATPEQVTDATVACWRSFYSLRAVLGRLRAGDANHEARMAVIVQRMVPAQLAGVAMTQGNRVLIEAVAGTGDRLVSGEANATREEHTDAASAPVPYNEVVALADALRAELACDVDIEWAWDGAGLNLLQARPVTAAVMPSETRRPLFAWESLYFADSLPRDVTLGACAEVFYAMTTKRSQLYRLAHRYGVHVNDGWIVTFNGAGLNDIAHQPAWWINLTGQIVVDLGTAARQNIIPAKQLTEFLAHVTDAGNDPYARHTAIVRRFIQGDSGAVTRRLFDGRTAMEHSTAGLLGINRGLDTTEPLILPAPDDIEAWPATTQPQHWPRQALRHIAEFTTVVTHRHPDAYLEWAVTGGQPHFIDHSVPKSHRTQPQSEGATTISPGTARGPLFKIEDTAELSELSVAPIVSIGSNAPVPASRYIGELLARISGIDPQPIVYARRPYAILSMLMEHAAGFVFDGGSTLCHLAILLREAGIPAVIAHKPIQDAQTLTIDDGAVYATERNPGQQP